MISKIVVFFCALFWTVTLSASPIYVFKEPDGTTRFTTKKPTSDIKYKVYKGREGSYSHYKVLQPRYSVSKSYLKSSAYKNKYADIISSASVQYGLAENVIKAVIHAESSFNPKAISNKGAKGLMQLMPQNLKKYGVKNPYDPRQNIYAGSKMLSKLISRYSGDLKLALAAYNAGEGAVSKYKGIPPYKETINYVKKVMHFRKLYS